MSPLGPTWDFFFLSPHAVALCGGVCGMMEPHAELIGAFWVSVCNEEGDAGQLCSLDLPSWCHSAFGRSRALLNEPKSAWTSSDGGSGTAGSCPSRGHCWVRAGMWDPGQAASPRCVASGWERASGLVLGCLNSTV